MASAVARGPAHACAAVSPDGARVRAERRRRRIALHAGRIRRRFLACAPEHAGLAADADPAALAALPVR